MSNISTTNKKRNFFKRNFEHFKAGVAIGFSISGISIVIAGIVLHLINPALGFVTIPLALQALLVATIKKIPNSIQLLKETVRDVLKDEDPDKVNSFVDEVVTTYTQNTARSNEPIAQHPVDTAIQTERSTNKIPNAKRIQMNGYYFPDEDRYMMTPRI